MNPPKFLTELKRRNVYRAAVAYGVVAWFLTQLTTQIFPFFEIPNSAVRFVVIALAVGFPIAMLLSWLYELTPEGIVRTEDLDPVQARSVQRASGRILDFIIIGVLLLVIAMMKSGTIRSSEGPGNQLRVNPTNFFIELKRRNVYRAAVAYGVVAWFLTQLTTQVFPFFEIPNSAVRFVVIALAVGFPIAMLLSWLYELTPEGIVRTEDVEPAQARSVQRASGRILDFIIIGVLLLVIAMMIVGRRPFYRQTGESISQKSIAVLPFENLSRDPDNAYFAEGIQEEILTRLAGIADLKVISRTSTQRYQSKPGNLAEIAKQLGVANILEGSVQKAGDQVRVNVQLVNAPNRFPPLGRHL